MNINLKNSVLFLSHHWASLFLAALVLFFSLMEPRFFELRNFNNILIASTALLLLATGETFVIISGGIDLSVGFVMGLASVTSATVMQHLYERGAGQPELVCILAGVAVGLAVGLIPGLVNGLLVARFRVPPFIATLGMYGIANGVALNICEGFPVSFLPPVTGRVGNGFMAYFSSKAGFSLFEKPELTTRVDILALKSFVPASVLMVAVIMVIFGFILSKTRLGLHTYAIGDNRDAALRSGIPVGRHLIKIYMISSFLASCAGVLLVLRFTMGNHTQFAAAYELFAIAAVVIGGASLMGGSGSIWGTMIGVLLLSTLEIGFVMVGLEVFYRYIAVGCILILAVFIDQILPKAMTRA